MKADGKARRDDAHLAGLTGEVRAGVGACRLHEEQLGHGAVAGQRLVKQGQGLPAEAGRSIDEDLLAGGEIGHEARLQNGDALAHLRIENIGAGLAGEDVGVHAEEPAIVVDEELAVCSERSSRCAPECPGLRDCAVERVDETVVVYEVPSQQIERLGSEATLHQAELAIVADALEAEEQRASRRVVDPADVDRLRLACSGFQALVDLCSASRRVNSHAPNAPSNRLNFGKRRLNSVHSGTAFAQSSRLDASMHSQYIKCAIVGAARRALWPADLSASSKRPVSNERLRIAALPKRRRGGAMRDRLAPVGLGLGEVAEAFGNQRRFDRRAKAVRESSGTAFADDLAGTLEASRIVAGWRTACNGRTGYRALRSRARSKRRVVSGDRTIVLRADPNDAPKPNADARLRSRSTVRCMVPPVAASAS